jgi:membrane protein involved in colicin uptake
MPEPEKPEETKPGETPEQKALREALADAEKWKALSRKNEEQAKSNADKAKKFDDHEEATKSELEKLQARAEAAEKVIAEREAKETAAKLREEVAAEKKFADRKISASALRGSTREELEAHADELLELVPAPPAAPSADGQGATGKPIGEGELSVNDIVAAATAR